MRLNSCLWHEWLIFRVFTRHIHHFLSTSTFLYYRRLLIVLNWATWRTSRQLILGPAYLVLVLTVLRNLMFILKIHESKIFKSSFNSYFLCFYLSMHSSIFAMAKFVYWLMFFTRILLATTGGLNHYFVMITDFSNRVLKTRLTEVSEFSSKSLLECGMKFDQFCGCFGYNTQTQVCRVFKTCSMNGPMEYEEGWIYYSLDKLSEKGEFHCTIQL